MKCPTDLYSALSRSAASILFAVAAVTGAIPKASGFLMLEEPVNARMVGMGSAGTAVDGGGFSFYNPVKPFFGDVSYVAFEYGLQSIDVKRGMLETAWVFPKWFIGGDFRSYSTSFTPATEQGPNTGISSWYQLSHAMIGAGVIRDRFALGIGANGIQERIGTFTASALSVSAGIGYKVIPGKLNIGAAGFNQGYSTGFMDSSAVWRNYGLPRVGRFGAGWSDTLKGVLPYTAAVDVVYRDEDKRIMVPLGVEVWPIQYLALRAGACINQGTELFNAGIGLRWSNFNFDAAFVTSRLVTDYEVKPLFGLTYYLGGQKNAAKKPEVIKTVPQNSSSPVISPVNSRTDSIQVIPPPAQPASITSETGTGVEKVDKTDEVESGNNLDRIDKSLPSDSLKTEEIRTETPSAIDSVIVK